MYAANTVTKEARMEDAAQVAATWMLVDGDETEVEDGDKEDSEEEEVVEVEGSGA
jgi:hypothetical protein